MCVLAIMDDPEMAGVERDTYNDGPLVPSGSTLCKACLVKGSRYPHCVPTLQDRQLSVPGSSASTPSAQAAAPRQAPTRTLTAPLRSQLWSDVSSGEGQVLAQFQRITNGLVRSTKNLLMIVVVERTD